MNLFDFIGNLVVTVIKSITNVINLLTGELKKKVLSLQNSRQELPTKQAQPYKPTSQTDTSKSNLFSPQNPVPGVDLLAKEGWTTVRVHPIPQTGQQVILLKNQKTNTAKMLGKEAFLKYLEELNEKHNR